MRTFDEVMADARTGSPFSNMTMFEMWAPRWCWAPCVHDNEATETYCPILSASLMGKTPSEWLMLGEVYGDYTCSEFEQGPDPDDEPPPAPSPAPSPVEELPGQLDLFGGEV